MRHFYHIFALFTPDWIDENLLNRKKIEVWGVTEQIMAFDFQVISKILLTNVQLSTANYYSNYHFCANSEFF